MSKATTVKDFFFSSLTARGMWDNDAEEVLKSFCRKEEHRYICEKFPGPLSHLDNMTLQITQMSVDQAANNWIKANRPKAFYAPLFESKR